MKCAFYEKKNLTHYNYFPSNLAIFFRISPLVDQWNRLTLQGLNTVRIRNVFSVFSTSMILCPFFGQIDHCPLICFPNPPFFCAFEGIVSTNSPHSFFGQIPCCFFCVQWCSAKRTATQVKLRWDVFVKPQGAAAFSWHELPPHLHSSLLPWLHRSHVLCIAWKISVESFICSWIKNACSQDPKSNLRQLKKWYSKKLKKTFQMDYIYIEIF